MHPEEKGQWKFHVWKPPSLTALISDSPSTKGNVNVSQDFCSVQYLSFCPEQLSSYVKHTYSKITTTQNPANSTHLSSDAV